MNVDHRKKDTYWLNKIPKNIQQNTIFKIHDSLKEIKDVEKEKK